ncbi:MAG: heavy metal translocating P-type ATPase [Bosea sp. (in: a-proteobacteria)]
MTISDTADRPAGGTLPLRFAVRGMTCASCVAHVETAVAGLAGVVGVEVNLPLERADVRIVAGGSPDKGASGALAARIVAAIADEGYEARLVADQMDAGSARARHAAEQEADEASLKRATINAAMLTLPVMVLEMGAHLVPAFHHWQLANMGEWAGQPTARWIALVLTTIVLAGPGRRFFSIGLPMLLRGRPEMNALVALGSGAAYLYSAVVTLVPALWPIDGTNIDGEHVYFESAAVIITLILLGRLIEMRGRGRTGAAISELLALQPGTAIRMRDGEQIDTPVGEIMVDDLILVKPGAGFPIDGIVVEGQSHANEAMLTGEPMPVAKRQGDPVHGGSVNGAGLLTIRATRVGGETLLAGIIRLVEEAQGAKLPIQGRIDQITAVFVPIVLAIAVLTFIVWFMFGPGGLPFALMTAVSVLIIACPCAMGLATPISVVVATGRAARFGALFRKGDALERLGLTRVVAFDKTGTLTAGLPELKHVAPADGVDESWILALAASVEAGSEHPIAHAIVAAAKARSLALHPVSDFAAAIGMGARGRIEGRDVAVGGARFMTSLDISIEGWDERITARAALGETPFLIAVDGAIAALLTVADPIKPEARDAVTALDALGLTTAMISGDHEATARSVAASLGITDVRAQILPAGKVEAIASLRQQHGAVAFVGDGINDAPALAAAEIGIAVGNGSTVAIESADVVLVSGHLAALPMAIGLSRATMRNINENLIWAFGYNVALIPVAAGVFQPLFGWTLSPMLAAGAMAFSSIFVVFNALRLRHFGTTHHG